MDTFDRLKEAAAAEWSTYVDHVFVQQLGEGTLPREAFQRYLVQDYLFLIHFARAWALAGYKGRSIEDIRAAHATLGAILQETELHVRLCGRWGISPEQLAATPEHQATVAYTRFVLDCGMSGDLLDLHVTLAPCVIGYAEIGNALGGNGVAADHPYREWIEEYAGDGFQSAARAARLELDRLAARAATPERFAELRGLFAAASRLEAAFWQAGLDA